MDLEMPVMDGFEATRQIKAFQPSCRVIALTIHAGENETADGNAGRGRRFHCQGRVPGMPAGIHPQSAHYKTNKPRRRMNMNTKHLLTASLIGGLTSLALANAPYLNLINLLLCAGFWIGPIVAVWLLRRLDGSLTLAKQS